jgi:FkbM family methyltransferase
LLKNKIKKNFLNISHVGGRGENNIFPITRLNKYIKYSIFEADPDCSAHLKLLYPDYDIITACISDKNKVKNFYLNQDRYTSSYLKPNNKYFNYYQEIDGSDALVAESLKMEKIIKLKTYSIDNLIKSKKIEPSDLISLDTQGSEYEILKGMNKNLINQIVGIKIEISFVQVYKNSKIFADIDKLLTKKNFFLAELNTYNDKLPYSNKLKIRISKFLRGRFLPLQGEALYLLRPESLSIKKKNSSHKLKKLAFCLIAYGFTDMAFLCLSMKKINYNKNSEIDKFLHQFKKIITDLKEEIPDLWQPKKGDNYSTEISNIKISPCIKNKATRMVIRFLNKFTIIIIKTIKWFKDIKEKDKFKKYKKILNFYKNNKLEICENNLVFKIKNL